MEVRYKQFKYTCFQFDMLSSIATSVDPPVHAYVIVGSVVIVMLIIIITVAIIIYCSHKERCSQDVMEHVEEGSTFIDQYQFTGWIDDPVTIESLFFGPHDLWLKHIIIMVTICNTLQYSNYCKIIVTALIDIIVLKLCTAYHPTQWDRS